MIDARIAHLLPRFLRDEALLAKLRLADDAYGREKSTGPLVIEAHYSHGEPLKAKVRIEDSVTLTQTTTKEHRE